MDPISYYAIQESFLGYLKGFLLFSDLEDEGVFSKEEIDRLGKNQLTNIQYLLLQNFEDV